MSKKPTFRTNPIVNAIGLATTLLTISGTAHASLGWADTIQANGQPGRIQTFFSHSPSGPHAIVPAEAGAGYDNVIGSGKALRKFVDPLPALGVPQKMADGVTDKYLPVAAPEKWRNPAGTLTSDDYYELAIVEYTDRFHSDLKKPTTLRGYVQLSTATNPGKALKLYYPNSSGKVAFAAADVVPADAAPIMIQATDANGKLQFDALGKPVKVQALAYDHPRYLGPTVVATKDTPTRIKFHNLLPVGRAVKTQTGVDPVTGVPIFNVTKRNGDLFLPVDPSLTGAGYGPDGVTKYTQNRASIHLHGGDTPWISDGTALQWFTPAGEADPTIPGSLATQLTDPITLESFLKGASAKNVPDMNDPGHGAYTFYYPNGQSARLLWYHDHAGGITRLNVMAGMAAAYVLTDPVEQDLITRGIIPGADATIPLVLQEKSFVPDDIALQDGRWNTTAWGAPGDMWVPHVYETVQDPAQMNSWNAVGRWHYGPWFWPVFPALYPLPSGAYGDETNVPESWGDTPVINGVAYPVLEIDPKPYRFRILNASNDRMFTFNTFVADETKPSPWSVQGNPAWDGVTMTPSYGEPVMVPAGNPANPCPAGEMRSQMIDALGAPAATYCTPDTWPVDGRNGGVPDPATQGPTMYQIANEGGLLPNVATIESAPTVPRYDVGRATVMNIEKTGLWIANAERADVIMDFSAYAGKTLIVYNDMHAPVPAADPRNDYFTGIGDQSAAGGAEDTLLGYGPNTRTMMQIKVRATSLTPGINFSPAVLGAEIPAAYAKSQERPIVAQSVYNAAFGTNWTDATAYASIFTGSLKQPQLQFTSGSADLFNGITVSNGGTGYTTAPAVVISGGGASKQAAAQATLKINQITVTDPGNGYLVAPAVSLITTNAPGSGATASATLKVTSVNITSGGSGYTTTPAVTFGMPQGAGGRQAKGTAVVAGGVVQSVTITDAGAGYTATPVITIAPPTAGTRAAATTTGGVDAVKLTMPDPANPNSAGGGGYTDLAAVSIRFTPPTGANPITPIATAFGKVFDITVNSPGVGYTSMPTVTLTGGGGTGATASATNMASFLVKTKAIQELFDATYGRLNATLGIEIPFTSAMTQTTVPLNFIDPPTEIIADGETQIWKITHNGVDSHPIHFHLYNVQLLNRVGWDGFIEVPKANEVGWKETVVMNPLEDAIVAVRAKKPTTPGWGAPNSIRPLDETQPLGSPFGFTQVDVNTGLPAVVVNAVQNFGWEYTWHCHILGHEENDFMRPVVFDAKEAAPTAPGRFTVSVPLYSAGLAYPGVTLNWTDTSSTEYKFQVLRADGLTSTVFTPIADVPANLGTFTDLNVNSATSYRYQVVAVGANGSAATGIVNATTPILPPLAPANVVATQGAGSAITVTWNDLSINENGFVVEVSVNGGAFTALTTVNRTGAVVAQTGGTVTINTTGVTDSTYVYRVASRGTGGTSNWVSSTPLQVMGPPAAPTGVTATPASPTSVKVNWVDGSLSEVTWTVQRATVTAGRIGNYAAVTGGTVTSTSVPTTGTGYTLTDPTAVNGVTYSYRVQAVNPRGVSAWVVSANVPVMFAPAAPTALNAAVTGQQVALSWTDNSTDETSFVVTGSLNGGASVTIGTVTVAAANRGTTGGTISLPTAYNAVGGSWTFSVVAVGIGGTSTAATAGPVTVVAPPISAPSAVTATVASATQVSLNWTDNANNETLFRVQRATVTNGVVGAFAQVGTVTRTGTATTGTGNVTFNDTTAAYGNTYIYQVQAENAGSVSGYVQSAQVSVTVAAPTNLAVAPATTTSARLTWVDNGPLETRYVVERSTNGGVTWNTLTSRLAANTTSYTATGLTAGTVYTFRVTAQRVQGGVTYASTPATVSLTMSAPVPPAAPLNLVSTGATTTTISLSWADNSTNETSFSIEGCRGATCTNWANYGTVTSTTGAATGAAYSFTDTGLRTRTTYRFRIVPMNGTTAGTPSAILNVTTN
ncbi:MAG: hypothetical protein RLY71_162 [Pseudomonadota bacterium]|jgi:FtsP/CotA-like multicopper oxidase with cupredoxin domain